MQSTIENPITQKDHGRIKTLLLGEQGLQVPAVGLGCMGMSEFYGDNAKDPHQLLDKALEIGCTFWDTADIYGPHHNEKLIGEALQQRREQITLATKFGIVRDQNGDWLGVNGRPEYVKASCDASLKRLKTDHIDLYYQHRPDPEVPIEDTVGAMADLVKDGKIQYIGLSEVSADILVRAHNTHPISALQTEYSLWSRDVEDNILATCQRLNIGFVAYSPLGRGFLTGAIQQRQDLQKGDWRLENPRFQEDAIAHNRQLLAGIHAIATRKNITTAQTALAWVLAQGDSIAAIPGTRHTDYLLQNVHAMDVQLSANDLADLNQLSQQHTTLGERY